MKSRLDIEERIEDLQLMFIHPKTGDFVDRVGNGEGLYSQGYEKALRWVLEGTDD